MRCINKACLRVMKNPSEKTKETQLCCNCRNAMIKKSESEPKVVIKVKPKAKKEKSTGERFDELVGGNKEYKKFCELFHKKEKPNVQSM